jgi:CheY-like chemotaxis protein
MAEQYAYDLKRLRGYEALIAKSGRTALESLTRDSVDCVILDLEMPGMDGFEVLRSVERLGLRVPIIVYTGTGDYDRCAQAIRLGAYSFIDKAEPMERVAQEVENAIERRRLETQVTLLRRGFGLESPLVGTSPALAKLKEGIVRIAPVPSPALIVGESGTGKELVAASCIASAQIRKDRSSRSAAPRCPMSWSKASCSAMSGARLPEPTSRAKAHSRRLVAGRCSSTRSVTYPPRPRPNCCVSSRRERSRGWAPTRPSR